MPADVPQILINRESLKHMNFDVELLGDCDGIVNELLLRLEEKRKQDKLTTDSHEWTDICPRKEPLTQIADQEAEQQFFINNKASNEPEIACSSSQSASAEQKQETKTDNECEFEKPAEEAATQMDPYKKYTKDFLTENSFLFLKPNVYVFHGAEVSLRNMKKKLRRLRKKMDMSDELASSESDESAGVDADKKNSKHSYLSEIYKSQPNDLPDDDDDEDDEFDDEFSTDETDSDSEDSDGSDDSDEADDEVDVLKNLNDVEKSDSDDEDFNVESNLNKNNLAEFLHENIEKTMKKKDS